MLAVDHWSNTGKIYRGVSAGSVALGGKTPEEARELFEDRVATHLKDIRLTGPERSSLDPGVMDVSFDTAATVDRAYAVGRRGGIFERFRDRAAASLGAAKVAPAVAYRPEAAYAAADELAARVDREPKAASVVIQDAKVEVVESREGYRLDVPATAGSVQRAVEEVTGEARMVGETLEPRIDTSVAEEAAAKARRATAGPVVLTAGEQRWTLSPAKIAEALEITPRGGELEVSLDRDGLRADLEVVYADLTVKPVEAGYEVNGGDVAVIPSEEGQRIEDEKLFGALGDGLFEGRREYEVPVAVHKPQLTTAEAEQVKPTELVGSYRTDYSLVSDTDARVENLEISSNAVNGTLLAPGEVFSMNDTVSSLDYQKTKVIVDGRETKADGGGLCQVTSTLYNAVNEAGLDVTERTPHYAQLPYIRPGLDATVWFGDERGEGALDMKFENTTDAHVLLREWVAKDGYVYAEVWGRPNDTEVKTWSERVYVGEDYSRWITYQTYKKGDKVVYDGVLHKDTYKPLIDEHGKKIPPKDVPVAPVSP
jgi:vancomycin resistance protein YoaR